MNNIIYCYLDLPITIRPQEEITTSERLYDNEKLLGRFKHTNTSELSLCRYTRDKINDKFIGEIVSAVPELDGYIRDVGMQKIYNEDLNPAGSLMIPHTDGIPRGRHCIQWLFNSGGPDVHTTWYIEDDHTAIRSPGLVDTNFSNLCPIEDVIFDTSRWTIFKTDIIHSVQTIYTSREALTIGFTNDQLFEKIINKYRVAGRS
jgi:hypothetical protein